MDWTAITRLGFKSLTVLNDLRISILRVPGAYTATKQVRWQIYKYRQLDNQAGIRQDGRVLKIHTWLVKTMKTKVTFTNFIPRVLQRVSQTINNLCNSCSFLPRHVTYCTGMKPEIFLAFGGFQLNLILRLLILGFYNPLNTPIMVRYANITNNNKRRYIQKYIISRGQLKALLSCAETWLLWTKAQLTLTGVKIANQNIFPNIRQFHNTVLTYSPCNELKMH